MLIQSERASSVRQCRTDPLRDLLFVVPIQPAAVALTADSLNGYLKSVVARKYLAFLPPFDGALRVEPPPNPVRVGVLLGQFAAPTAEHADIGLRERHALMAQQVGGVGVFTDRSYL